MQVNKTLQASPGYQSKMLDYDTPGIGSRSLESKTKLDRKAVDFFKFIQCITNLLSTYDISFQSHVLCCLYEEV